MDVTPELREAVAEWVGEGFSLSEIQRLLSEKFGHTLTYMDVRFLVDDLGLSLQDPETDQASEQDSALSSLGRVTEPSSGEDAELEYSGASSKSSAMADEDDILSASVRLEVDSLVRPGAVVSGSAVFSDGMKADWFIDQLGRLGLNPKVEGYQPSEEDLQAFQSELQGVLQKKGF